ncbi:MAG: hypothetical protein E7391_06540 [Ruminococcaceae bacterium]|nr:hypothetical protein [Oscillospiraceae bacterium]
MLDKTKVRKLWLQDATEQKEFLDTVVKDNIEKYRKGDCKFRFTDENGNILANKKVKINQISHDFKYGANILMLDEFKDDELNKKYREQFKKHFNLATVPFYWDALEPEEGKERFDKNSPKIYRRPAPDLCLEYCNENGIDAKLHCLVYDKFIPKWLPRDNMEKMEELYEKRIKEIAKRYKGKLYEFEVINEVGLEREWEYKSKISEKRDVVEWSFNMARKYLPDETLVINEGGSPIYFLGSDDYRSAYFMLCNLALKNGASIDKIGLQHHTFTGSTSKTEEEYEKAVMQKINKFNPKFILRALDIISELNLPLEITEVTIPTFGFDKEDEILQADLLEVLYTTFFSHKNVNEVVYWNLPDGCAYEIDGWNENNVKGGLFKKDMTPKESAKRLHYLFNEKWHTDLELVTDENGCVNFRGFYGNYVAEIDGKKYNFGLHKKD